MSINLEHLESLLEREQERFESRFQKCKELQIELQERWEEIESQRNGIIALRKVLIEAGLKPEYLFEPHSISELKKKAKLNIS